VNGNELIGVNVVFHSPRNVAYRALNPNEIGLVERVLVPAHARSFRFFSVFPKEVHSAGLARRIARRISNVQRRVPSRS